MKNEATQRKLFIAGGIIAAILIIFGTITGIRKQLEGGLQVNVVPKDSTIMIGTTKVPANKLVGIGAGTYTVAVSRNGFATQKKSVTIKSRQNNTQAFYLAPNSPAGEQWLSDNPLQAYLLEGNSSRSYDQLAASNTAKYPIVTQLPMYDPSFSITYGASQEHPKDSSAIALYINAYDPSARQAALQLIRDKGFDPSDMEIVFTP